MSFLIKNIQMTLDPASIEKAIREVHLIQDKLQPAMMYLIGKLAEKGVEIAKAELIFFENPAYDTGALSNSIKFRYDDDMAGATITAGEGLGCGPADYDISYAFFVEYGTGIYGADVNGHGLNGWWYPSPNGWWTPKTGDYKGRSMAHTVGMPPRPFMQNTYAHLIEEAEKSGGRIVAEYLRDF